MPATPGQRKAAEEGSTQGGGPDQVACRLGYSEETLPSQKVRDHERFLDLHLRSVSNTRDDQSLLEHGARGLFSATPNYHTGFATKPRHDAWSAGSSPFGTAEPSSVVEIVVSRGRRVGDVRAFDQFPVANDHVLHAEWKRQVGGRSPFATAGG